MTRRHAIRFTAAGLAVAFLAVVWIALAPVQLGGSTSYALIVGTSMEPKLHRGDLAVVRAQSDYGVGDVILFRDSTLGRDVLHRIVARSGDRFVTKGDNNTYRDAYRPAAGDVHGRLAAIGPGVGRPLEWLRTPWHAALLVALTALFALTVGSGAGVAARGRGRPAAVLARRPAQSFPASREAILAGALGAIGVLAFVALIAWTKPATRPVAQQAYVQQGTWQYRAESARAEVYSDGAADTGEPVFLRLAHDVDVTFGWRLDTELAHTVSGTAGLDAVLSDGRGWQRRFALVPVRGFSGDDVQLAGRLDLDRVRAAAARVERLTGAGTTTWSVRLEPRVGAAATIDGRSVPLAFDSPLAFTLDPVRLQPDLGESSLDTAVAPRIAGTLDRAEANELAFGFDVGFVRWLALLGIAAALAVAAWARSGVRPSARPDDHALIAHRLGDLLVEAAPPARAQGRLVELDGADGLLRVAEATGRLVLHARTPLGHEYVVDDGVTVYRFRTGVAGADTAVLRATGTDR